MNYSTGENGPLIEMVRPNGQWREDTIRFINREMEERWSHLLEGDVQTARDYAILSRFGLDYLKERQKTRMGPVLPGFGLLAAIVAGKTALKEAFRGGNVPQQNSPAIRQVMCLLENQISVLRRALS